MEGTADTHVSKRSIAKCFGRIHRGIVTLLQLIYGMQIAKEWMRRHMEGESQRVVEEGGLPAVRAAGDPQRLIDALVSITASDTRSSHLGAGLQSVLAPLKSLLIAAPLQLRGAPAAGKTDLQHAQQVATDAAAGGDADVDMVHGEAGMHAPLSHRSQISSTMRLSERGGVGGAALHGVRGLQTPAGGPLPPGVQPQGTLGLSCALATCFRQRWEILFLALPRVDAAGFPSENHSVLAHMPVL